MKKFFKNIVDEFKSYDLLVILISSAVGAVFSLIPVIIAGNANGGGYALIVFLSILFFIFFIAGFLITIIVVNYSQKKFHYIHMIDNAYKKQNWLAVYTFGAPLSTPLWRMSKLSLRIKVAKMVKDAILKLKSAGVTEVNDKAFDADAELAKLYIDDLGYTDYVLGNLADSIKSIYEGLSYAQNISSEKKRLVITLKGQRHLLAMCSNNDITKKNEVDSIFYAFNNTLQSATKYVNADDKLDAEILYAEYALIKYNYQKQRKDVVAIYNDIKSLRDKLCGKKKTEWVEKCDQLIWEIDLKNGTIGHNAGDVSAKISSASIFPNRFLKILNLYLDYRIYEAMNYRFTPNRYEKRDTLKKLREIKSDVKNIIKEASKQIIESEDRISLANYKQKNAKFFTTINRRIREAKRMWLVDKYNIILIDFDYTIYNYRKAQEKALKAVFKEYSWKYNREYADTYRKINDGCWYEYKDALDFSTIKSERVKRFIQQIGIKKFDSEQSINEFIQKMDDYMTAPILMPGVKKFLKKIKGKRILVITDAGKGRRERTLQTFSKKTPLPIFSSEDCLKLKTDQDYYKCALEKIQKNIDYKTVLVIGDSIDSDIRGARALDIDTCFIGEGYHLRKDLAPPKCEESTYQYDTFKVLNKQLIPFA